MPLVRMYDMREWQAKGRKGASAQVRSTEKEVFRMQKLIVCSVHEVERRINEYLHDGWTAVPGTLVLQSLEQVRPKLSNDPATPSNTIFKPTVAIVLRRVGDSEVKSDVVSP